MCLCEPHLKGGVDDVLLGSLGRNPQRPKLGKLHKKFIPTPKPQSGQVIIDPKPELL